LSSSPETQRDFTYIAVILCHQQVHEIPSDINCVTTDIHLQLLHEINDANPKTDPNSTLTLILHFMKSPKYTRSLYYIYIELTY